MAGPLVSWRNAEHSGRTKESPGHGAGGEFKIEIGDRHQSSNLLSSRMFICGFVNNRMQVEQKIGHPPPAALLGSASQRGIPLAHTVDKENKSGRTTKSRSGGSLPESLRAASRRAERLPLRPGRWVRSSFHNSIVAVLILPVPLRPYEVF